MRLADLLKGFAPLSAPLGAREVAGVTSDSRKVLPGYLFVALSGNRDDGLRYVEDALARGAVAIVTAETAPQKDAPWIQVSNSRAALAQIAARFFADQPAHIAAVTGTSGKTSVVEFTRQIFAHAGQRAASLGTLGLRAPNIELYGGLTTPDPVMLHQTLAQLVKNDVDYLAMEASSHGIDQHRLDGVRLQAAAFLNLSRDHLDYHADMDSYFMAKAELFSRLLPPGETAVLNADSERYAALMEICTRRGQRILSYGQAGRDLRLVSAHPHPRGLMSRLDIQGRIIDCDWPLIGPFQAGNVLAAAGLALGCGLTVEAVAKALPNLTAVKGRMQKIGETASGGVVFIDYAHKPGALDAVLTALRLHTAARLHVVFGCGGDRDAGKRPEMGAIAARLADVVYVTDDNPRSEDPALIRKAILAACPGAHEFDDRAKAIHTAIQALAQGDLLVIAGKGHEQGQEIKGEVRPFDDAQVALQALRVPRPEVAQ